MSALASCTVLFLVLSSRPRVRERQCVRDIFRTQLGIAAPNDWSSPVCYTLLVGRGDAQPRGRSARRHPPPARRLEEGVVALDASDTYYGLPGEP
jgi:hypothetical protein